MNIKTFFDTALVSDHTGIYNLPLTETIDVYDNTIDIDSLTIVDTLEINTEIEDMK